MNSERTFINQLAPGEAIDQVFLVRDKDLRTAKTGDMYLSCTLCDRTGNVPARMWKVSESIFKSIPTDGYLQVKGRTDEYRGNLQIIIDACRPLPADKVDEADFVPVTELDAEAMWAELLEILRRVKDKHLRLLIKKFTEDRELVAGFKRSPAAMQMHHPFLGGLLEHTLNVARNAQALLPLYPKLNADLVLTGVFLHDIGKIAELSAGTSMQYTDRGQLVGHITIAAIWIGEKASAVAAETSEPFPAKTLDLLQHLVLSHHGVHEYGSPKLPMIPESFFLHYLDNLDAKVWMTTHQIVNDPNDDSAFTPFSRQLETRLYKHSQEL
jgi:3'-5' exoribonuclease